MKRAHAAARLILGLVSVLALAVLARSTITPSTDFRISIDTGAGLGIQTDYEQYILMQVQAGTWNTTANTVRSYDGVGLLRFTNNESATLGITFTVAKVTVSGDQNNSKRVITSGDLIQMAASDTVIIEWTTYYEPFVPVLFIFGILGLCATPAGLIIMFKDGVDLDMENLSVGITLVVVGISFILIWVFA